MLKFSKYTDEYVKNIKGSVFCEKKIRIDFFFEKIINENENISKFYGFISGIFKW